MTKFCRTVLYVIIVNLVIFAGHLSDRIKYFVSQSETFLVLTDRPALFVKTGVLTLLQEYVNIIDNVRNTNVNFY